MSRWQIAIWCILFSFLSPPVHGSHIVGGEMTYKFLGDSLSFEKYEVTVIIYEDCVTGIPSVIEQDNPAFLAVYNAAAPYSFVKADSVYYALSESVPANFSNACVTKIPQTCLLKKTFVIDFALPRNGQGYIVDYQRCCRNATVNNIIDPSDNGSTFFCTIPPAPLRNNSAVFKNFPPQIICVNNPLFYDNSAADADGDSLSYGFVSSLNGATGSNSKPWPPGPPPFDSTVYIPPYSSQNPMPGYPAIQIDPRSGLITGTPNLTGRYLVSVYCDEYRDGIKINRITREFQFVVTSCSKVVVANIPINNPPNTYIVDCQDYTVHFVDSSRGGFAYHWDFGVPGANDTSSDFQPTFTYPDTGTFAVKLVVNPGSTCPDSITRLVKVYPRFHAAFTDSGGSCPGSAVYFLDRSSSTLQPITYWSWSFGDGGSSLEQNPVHTYRAGGLYNVILTSHNYKDCADTVLKQIIIDNFSPFAGNDTTIVKGEKVQFSATGGIDYLWQPSLNLSDTNIYNPTGFYPDTGHFTYIVQVTSPYGCTGYDTIKVTVLNQASFVVPSAFTPNGDGLNDYFRPIAIGYRSLNYFRVFNRWGEEVYFSTDLETGWDGTYRRKQADMGTYYWEISFTDRFGKEGSMKGDVTLIR